MSIILSESSSSPSRSRPGVPGAAISAEGVVGAAGSGAGLSGGAGTGDAALFGSVCGVTVSKST